MCSEALFFIPQNIEKILRRISRNLNDRKVRRPLRRCSSPSWLGTWPYILSVRWPRYRYMNKTLESVIVGRGAWPPLWRLSCQTPAPFSRNNSVSKTWPSWSVTRSRHSFLLKNLNHFLANTVLDSQSQSGTILGFIHIEDTDILISTVRIVKQGLQFNSAARELRVEFRKLYKESERSRTWGSRSCSEERETTAFRVGQPAHSRAWQWKSTHSNRLRQPPQLRRRTMPPPVKYSSPRLARLRRRPAMSISQCHPTPRRRPERPTPSCPCPLPRPSSHTHSEPPPSATLPTMPMPTSSGDEESV
jgi:hypothetical protein